MNLNVAGMMSPAEESDGCPGPWSTCRALTWSINHYAVINRTANRWFACLWVEDGQQLPPVKHGSTIGVDVGIERLAVCSDGRVVENPRALRPALKLLRRMDKAIARSRNNHGRAEPSNRRERLLGRRRRLHARIFNVRNDAHHKATTTIAKSAGRVVIEDLNVAGMMRNRRLSRALATCRA